MWQTVRCTVGIAVGCGSNTAVLCETGVTRLSVAQFHNSMASSLFLNFSLFLEQSISGRKERELHVRVRVHTRE
jgi:hypothetical protein